MCNEIIKNIKEACQNEQIGDPHILQNLEKYTVGESGAIIFGSIRSKAK